MRPSAAGDSRSGRRGCASGFGMGLVSGPASGAGILGRGSGRGSGEGIWGRGSGVALSSLGGFGVSRLRSWPCPSPPRGSALGRGGRPSGVSFLPGIASGFLGCGPGVGIGFDSSPGLPGWSVLGLPFGSSGVASPSGLVLGLGAASGFGLAGFCGDGSPRLGPAGMAGGAATGSLGSRSGFPPGLLPGGLLSGPAGGAAGSFLSGFAFGLSGAGFVGSLTGPGFGSAPGGPFGFLSMSRREPSGFSGASFSPPGTGAGSPLGFWPGGVSLPVSGSRPGAPRPGATGS